MNSGRNFFYDLSERVRELIAEAIDEKERDWLSFVKSRRNEITLSTPGQESGTSRLQLQFLGVENVAETEGTFIASNDSTDDVLVFRYPSRILATYQLTVRDMDVRESLQVFDGLNATFFNKKSVEPFIPEGFKAIPDLYSRMSATRAELALKKAGVSAGSNSYGIVLEYRGLYHSGDPIRSEKRVRQRNLSINKTNEGVL